MPIPTTMTFYARAFHGPNGRMRHVAVSLPYVGCIADEPHYQRPPSAEPQKRGPNFALRESKASRRRMSKAIEKIEFERVTKRIMEKGF